MEPNYPEQYGGRLALLWLSRSSGREQSFYPYQLLQRKAEVLDIIGQWNLAESIHRHGLALAEVHADGRLLADARAQLAGVLFKKGRYAETFGLLEQALTYYQAAGDSAAAGRMLGEIGNVHRAQGDYDRAMECYQRHLVIAEDSEDWHAVSKTVGNMGNVHRVRGQHDRAMECYRREARLSEALGDRQAVALATGNIGLVHFNQGDYSQALEYTGKFLNSAQSLGDKRNLGVAYGVLGNIYRQQNRLDEAMDAYRRQLEIMTELGDIRSKTYALGNIGRVYRLQYDYPMAMEYYRRHLALAEELGDKRSISFAEGALGGAYKELLAFPKSWAHYQRAIALCRELKLAPELTDNLIQTAELMLNHDAARARELNDEALALAAETGNRESLFSGRLLQARITALDDRTAAAGMMRALLDGELNGSQQAETWYRLFRLTNDEDSRRQARSAFLSAHGTSPDPIIKLRLEELS